MTTWIFQGNPNFFDITGYLRARSNIVWEARQKRELMAAGDIVYMWRADGGKPGTGGVIARGTIITAPQLIDDIDAEEFYPPAHKAKAHIQTWRVKIHIDSLHLNEPALPRVKARNDSVLSEMLILKVSVMTNYLLNPGEANRVGEFYHQAQG